MSESGVTWPMRRKIMIAVMLIVTLALSSFAALVIVKTRSITQQSAVDALQTLARGSAHHATAALAFDDDTTAKETLDMMGSDREVVLGRLYSRDGVLLAEYNRPGERSEPYKLLIESILRKSRAEGASDRAVVEFQDDVLVLAQPVVLNTKVLGHLVAIRGLDSLYGLLWSIVATVVAAAGVTLALTFVAANYLSRVFTKPLSDLERVMAGVSKKGDYTVRVITTSSDEVGALMREFNGMLEQIDRRDRDLANAIDELKNARDAAELASRVKSQFLANMSHELRTPLNAIIGYSEMLAEDARNDQHTGYVAELDRICIAAQHLLTLINDILDLSRVESGKMQFMYEPTDVEETVEGAMAMMKSQAESGGNQFVVRYNLSGRYATLDALRFKQVLVNLVGNACKFCRNGEISVGVRNITRDGRACLEVAVKDAGIGIPEDKLAGLFEVFSQVDGSYTRRYGGTGLGLALCRRLCRAMGGDIEVESIVGVGSVFTFWIPGDHPAWGEEPNVVLTSPSLANGQNTRIDRSSENKIHDQGL